MAGGRNARDCVMRDLIEGKDAHKLFRVKQWFRIVLGTLCVCSRDDILSERRGMYALIGDLMEFGRTPRRTNRPESGPSLYEVI